MSEVLVPCWLLWVLGVGAYLALGVLVGRQVFRNSVRSHRQQYPTLKVRVGEHTFFGVMSLLGWPLVGPVLVLMWLVSCGQTKLCD